MTVNGGTGGGSYAEDATVTITAEDAPDGQRFTGWTVNAGGVILTNASSATTTFTMPAQAVTITANFQNNSSGGPSGDVGGSGTTTTPMQKPNIEDSTGGSTTVTPVRPGETVTIRPKLDEGYEVEKTP